MKATNTLLIRCAAPFQSWGTMDDGRNDVRYSDKVPTKSAIIGMLASARGIIERRAVAGELAQIRMGVRIDTPGIMLQDFQTVGKFGAGMRYANGKIGGSLVTKRYYLTDGDFLVGLEHSSLEMLESLAENVRRPATPLYLGRKACVPGVPVWIPDGLLRGSSLEDALRSYPWPRFGEVGHKRNDKMVLRTLEEVRNLDDADYMVADSPMSTTFLNPGERDENFNEGMMGSRGIKESNVYVSLSGAGVPLRREEEYGS